MSAGKGKKGEVRTRLSNVLRFPTNTMSPSTKYAYSVWTTVRITYLQGQNYDQHLRSTYETIRAWRSLAARHQFGGCAMYAMRREGDTYAITPAHTTGLPCSKGTRQPYRPVAPATSTESQPRANRTSVCV